ncbi:uncharacterized protein LOC127150769 [Cucumis melo]|uniref:Uncharacterized protein LOC127150769 n=1 Tax=Cucumis melo TaxID=3656 RepID=A0ABM3L5P9_CUCME|nr:uncharacterized protein LOC127150769 [Cucumis melo]XP_050945361.1 uncharacterized protein LOC127150769 [Cucumis melo]XP_050945362.1 uncharacterized protein LOC127150769 [Cucumis melo]XP_050945363.1 uncharacterized protein LOC127150769 [Cucumis melo]
MPNRDGDSFHSIKFLIQCHTSFAIIFMVLTMPISTSFGTSFERAFQQILPSGLTSVSKPRWNNKIQVLANFNLKETPQLVELVDDSKEVKELIGLALEKVLLKWMNFHLEKAGY